MRKGLSICVEEMHASNYVEQVGIYITGSKHSQRGEIVQNKTLADEGRTCCQLGFTSVTFLSWPPLKSPSSATAQKSQVTWYFFLFPALHATSNSKNCGASFLCFLIRLSLFVNVVHGIFLNPKCICKFFSQMHQIHVDASFCLTSMCVPMQIHSNKSIKCVTHL